MSQIGSGKIGKHTGLSKVSYIVIIHLSKSNQVIKKVTQLRINTSSGETPPPHVISLHVNFSLSTIDTTYTKMFYM